MNQLNLAGTGVSQMTISVRVLTVDGNRRMSRSLFRQIPEGLPVDPPDADELVDGVELWGIVGSRMFRHLLWTHDGGLYVANLRVCSGDHLEWEAERRIYTVAGPVVALLRELPQLYVGG
jgi:hypothetical protein